MEKANNEVNMSLGTNIVYSLIVFIRDQVKYYEDLFPIELIQSNSITTLVVKVLYDLLMKDVKEFCETETNLLDSLNSATLNLNFLAVAYRLNQLDSVYSHIVSQE